MIGFCGWKEDWLKERRGADGKVCWKYLRLYFLTFLFTLQAIIIDIIKLNKPNPSRIGPDILAALFPVDEGGFVAVIIIPIRNDVVARQSKYVEHLVSHT